MLAGGLIHDQAVAVVNSNDELAPHLRSICKELLHHHILRSLNSCGILRKITFMGGTCLRLCHGGMRFSEDLDFRGGDFDGLEENLGEQLEQALLKRGVTATVRRAGLSSEASENVERWWVRVVVREGTPKGQPSVERIKLDIDSRPRTESLESVPLLDHFGGLAGDLSEGPLTPCLPMLDICADKLVALPSSVAQRPEYPRYRDIFDLGWAAPRLDEDALIRRAKKVAGERGISEAVRDAISETLPQLPDILGSERYRQAMGRFLPKSTADTTVNSTEHRHFATQVLERQLKRLDSALASKQRPRPP